jgi:hypothetical protein
LDEKKKLTITDNVGIARTFICSDSTPWYMYVVASRVDDGSSVDVDLFGVVLLEGKDLVYCG